MDECSTALVVPWLAKNESPTSMSGKGYLRRRPSQWEENFQAVAEAFNLTLPAPGQEHLYIPSPCAELAEQVPT